MCNTLPLPYISFHSILYNPYNCHNFIKITKAQNGQAYLAVPWNIQNGFSPFFFIIFGLWPEIKAQSS